MAGIYDKFLTSDQYNLTDSDEMRKKKKQQYTMSAMEDSAPDASTGNDMTQNIAKAAPQMASGGGGAADKIAMMGMASGNPYAMAAGLGLSVLSGAAKAKQQREQQRRQQVLNALGNIGAGVGSIG